MACYVWQGRGADNNNYAFALCTTGSPSWIIGSVYPSGTYRLPAVNGSLAPGASDFYVTPDAIINAPTVTQYNAAIANRGLRGNCNGCTTTGTLYDCINGSCFPSTQFNTPGIYSTLQECQTACGTGCSGKCIPSEEWAQIESLTAQLKQRNCS